MLEIKNVSKMFDNTGVDVLENVNVTIKEGEFICMVGPSGAGKSTLLNLVAGLEKPTQGEILLDGEPVTGPGRDRVVMFQESALFPWMNVMENVKFGMKVAGLSKEEQEERGRKYLEMVHMTGYEDYKISHLSGGMRQRVQLARALCLDSKILLMDEPFSALDKQTINILREEVESIWEQTGKTVILITHSVEEAMFFADKIYLMSAKEHTITQEYEICMPRPRDIEAGEFVHLRKEILRQIRHQMAPKQ